MLLVEKLMRIGQMSKQTGVSIDAIRFYERNGLLAAPARSEGGFRLILLTLFPPCNSSATCRRWVFRWMKSENLCL